MIPRHIALVSSFALLSLFSVASAAQCSMVWDKTLRKGMTGPQVSALQAYFGLEQAGIYGNKTVAAVKAFQKKNGITQTGELGPKTRAVLNSLCVVPLASTATLTGQVNGVEIVADALTVSDAAQPSPTLAPPNALYVPFTRFTLTAGPKDVTVKSITVKRVGMGQDQAFDYISLLDDSNSEVTYGYIGSEHKIVFNRDTITIPAGESQIFTIAGNMKDDLTDYDGQMPALRLSAIVASSPVGGTLPITGTMQTINESLTIGTAETALSSFDPGAANNRTINDTAVRFSGIRISAGSKEDLILKGITWRQNGSASMNDLANVVVTVDGISYPTEVSDGRDYYASIQNTIIPKGFSKDIYISGDILPSAANRTVKFDIKDSANIEVWGKMYGFGIAPYPASNTADTGESVFLTTDGTTDGDSLSPFFSGSTATIYGATINGFSKI
ncbi:peptidoglycan-binding protein [bacterium]|nr:peptidoglycan-binding protein [bacterium]